MSKCKNLKSAKAGMEVFCRTHPSKNLFRTQIFDILQEDREVSFKGDIVVRFISKMAKEGYYDVVFLPDGRQREGGWQQAAYSIYPVTKKYKAIHKLEEKYAQT